MNHVTYAVREIAKHGTDRQWWRKRFLTHVVGRYFSATSHDSDSIVDQDWDNAIILDACRADLFQEVYEEDPLPGELRTRQSVQSATPGFLTENFGDDTYHDTVYVTGNPFVQTKLAADTFHAVDHVWRDNWDETVGTVRPEHVVERALAASERYPNKRLLVHFNQPHTPFIGERRLDGRGMNGVRESALGNDGPDPQERPPTPFELLGSGEASYDDVWAAYRDNLAVVWPATRKLLNELPGLTRVTSDHGNALGERAWPFPIRVYGHPLNVTIPSLTTVPDLVYENGARREIRADEPEHTGAESEELQVGTADRLRDLGYLPDA